MSKKVIKRTIYNKETGLITEKSSYGPILYSSFDADLTKGNGKNYKEFKILRQCSRNSHNQYER